MRRSRNPSPRRQYTGTGTTPPRLAFPSLALALLLTLLAGTPASAQSAWAYLTADPTVFQSGQSIALTAQFYADVDYEYSPWYYPIVRWEAWLETYGSNQFVSPSAAYDEWLNECFYYGGASCEGGGQLYRNPWLLLMESDHGPGQTMAATEYITNGVATYYVAFCVEGACWDVPMPSVGDSWYAAVMPQQQTPPELRLFLDATGTFQQPQHDQSATYLPGTVHDAGSNQATHESVLPQPEGTPLVSVRLIAAFVDGSSGQIVPPPSGVTTVTFSLDNTSAFVGYAMNAGTSTAPDFALLSNATPSFTGNLATVDLGVFDYGGFTTARVSASGQPPVEIRIPRDDNSNGNWLPDGGWRPWAGGGADFVADVFGQCGSPAECDRDNMPAVTGQPAAGTVGDGFTNFEEYRGFLVRGEHRRTDPRHKDLFVSSNVVVQGVDVGIFYAFPKLTSATHRVFTPAQATAANSIIEYDPTSRVINTNHQNGSVGGHIPSRVDQMALVVRAIAFNFNTWWGCTILTAGTCQAANGVAPTNKINRIEIDVPELVADATANGWNVLESARWIIGHEVGHGVNMCHRPQHSTCTWVVVGPGPSLMNSTLSGGLGPIGDWIEYTPGDLEQIRLHDRPPPTP